MRPRFFLFAVLPRSLALDLSAVDARARGSFAVLKWSGQSPARRRACEPCADVASVGSGQTHPHSFRRMVFEELPLVATETTVPRGRVSSAGKLGCSCVVSLPCLPDFCALATAELGGTRGGEEGDHEEPGPHAAHGRQEEEGIPPPELCWAIAEAVACSENLWPGQ